MNSLNLFYEEPDYDRLLPFDRYGRRLVRRIVRGKPRVGGQARAFLNLLAGLDRLGIHYRVNDYRRAARHSDEVVGIFGKPHLLNKTLWKNPILFGAAVYSHPSDDPDLLTRLPIRKILVPGEWMRQMCEPVWGERVCAWPVGIDTRTWAPSPQEGKDIDVLLYDKVMWRPENFEGEFISPIISELKRKKLRFVTLRYGFYREEEFRRLLAKSRMMIFLCEHETQGIAYQQTLSCGVPILAWDRGGYWQDPAYYPHRVKFAPVTSVPYWDVRCGEKFEHIGKFAESLDAFLDKETRRGFAPRDYILESLTLEKCAHEYLQFYAELSN